MPRLKFRVRVWRAEVGASCLNRHSGCMRFTLMVRLSLGVRVRVRLIASFRLRARLRYSVRGR